MTGKEKLLLALDRTAVLFVGLAVGGAIGFSFVGGSAGTTDSATANTPAPTLASATTLTRAAPSGTFVGPRLREAVQTGRTVQIGVFGDSFGDGIWAGLYNQIPDAEGFKIHQLARQATGFTRYRTTNLLDDTRQRLARQPIDIAVLSFGANDTQGIFQDGHAAAYMSPEWQQIVTERVDAVVGLLREHGAAVYWVGLPKMREPAFDAQIARMNAFYAERMRALSVPFIDTAAQSVDASGQYAPYLTDSRGRRVNARLNDGIHMTIPGYLILTQSLSGRIRETVAELRRESGVSPPDRTANGQRRARNIPDATGRQAI